MNRFCGGDNVRYTSSLETATLDGRGRAKVNEVVNTISSTSDYVLTNCESGTRNGDMIFISNEDTDSVTSFELVGFKSPPPHSQNLQGDSNASMKFFWGNKVNHW